MQQKLNLFTSFPTIKNNVETHILIIGDGLCSIQLAYYLQNLNEDAMIITQNQIFSNIHPYPLLTAQQGYLYNSLSTRYDTYFAKLYYNANQETIQDIERIIRKHHLNCNFKQCDSILYANNYIDIKKLENEYECYRNLQIPCNFYQSTNSNPYTTLIMHYQASYHPIHYIQGLLSTIPNFPIYENCKIKDIKENENNYTVYCNGYTIQTDKIIFINPQSIDFINQLYQPYLIQQQLHIKNASDFAIPLNNKLSFYSPTQQNYTLLTQTTFDQIPFVGKIYKDNENLLFVAGCSIWEPLLSCLSAKLLLSHILEKHNLYRFVFSPQRIDFCNEAFQQNNSISL